MSEGGKGAGAGAGGVGGEVERVVMRRLLDEPAGNPLTTRGWAVGLLRRSAPHRAPVGRKHRVRLALGQGGRRRALPLLRTAIAGAVLVGCGAAASAALGRWPEIVEAYHRLLAPPSSSAIAGAEARSRRPAAGQPARPTSSPESVATPVEPAPSEAAAPEPLAAPVGSAPAASLPASPGLRGPARSAMTRASLHGSSASWRPRRASHAPVAMAATTTTPPPRPTLKASGAPPAGSAAPSPRTEMTEDTTPVLEAMRALRVEANPTRARRLLAGYLERYPSGSLAEEALAMSIEAAVAHGDGDATTLARKYVRRYPSGHFSALARRTLDGAAGAVN